MNIIVTGGSNGIGYELVKQLALSGMHTILVIARNEQKLEQLKNEIKTLNTASSIHLLPFDLSKESAAAHISKSVVNYFSSIDILVNNAGFLVNKPFVELTREDIRQTFEVNLFSIISLTQALLPLMGKPHTHIVNVGSMGGFQGSSKFPGLSVYSASKAALANLTECLAEEFKSKNISVNCLALGAVQTEMLQNAFPGYKAPVTPSEIAPFISNFSLNGNKYLNGKIIPVSLSIP